MSGKEEKKPKGLEELGKFFSFDFNVLGDFIVQSSLKKVQEILKEDIQISGILMSLTKSKRVVFLLAGPKSEGVEKTLLMSTGDEGAEKIYEAFSSLKKR